MNIIDNLSYHSVFENGGSKFSVGGEFIGAILGDDFSKSIKQSLKFYDYDVESMILNALGRFYIKVEGHEIIELYSSISDYGVYYQIVDDGFVFSRDHNTFSTTIDYEMAVASTKTHHLVGRSRYGKEIFNNIKRIFPGCKLIVKGGIGTMLTFLVKPNRYENHLIQRDLLNKLIKKVIDCYQLNSEDCLLFSGGIDSAVLASTVRNNEIDFVNFRYDQEGSDDAQIVKEFKQNVFHKIKFQGTELMNVENIINLYKRDYISIPGPQYLKSRNLKYKRLITGQNLDTLLHIDTFAPGSAYQGFVGFLMNLKLLRKRLPISPQIINSKTNSKFLSVFGILKFDNIYSLIENLYQSNSEHSEIELSNKVDLNGNGFVSELIKRSLKYYLNNKSISSYKILKISRFYKTCHNVNLNYKALKYDGCNDRITPYTEGPLAHYLISTKIPVSHLFFPKKIMYDIYKQNMNHSYKDISSCTGKNNIFKYLISKFRDKPDFQTDDFHEINTIIEVLINGVKSPLSEFEPIFSKFITGKEKLSKADYLLLCRCLNMNYFIEENDFYFN